MGQKGPEGESMGFDDEFKKFAQQVEQEEKEKASRRGNVFAANYENIKWTGLEKGKMKIIRALGGVPNSGATPGTARIVRIARIVNDKKNFIRVILPSRESSEGNSYILWRVIDRIMEVQWVNKQKVFVHEKAHPEIFNIVFRNNIDTQRFGLESRGWMGREMFIMNCIDRDPLVYQWSKENKHAVLLSKNVAVITTPEGKILEFPEEGVPAFGFTNILATTIFKYYGNWTNYDLGIEKTGLMQPPMRIINASKHIEEVPEDVRNQVVVGPLTEEEKSWELYNLDKLFAPTSYSKLWKNLKLTFQMIDAQLGSHYSEELKALAEEEAKAFKEAGAEKQSEDYSVEEQFTPSISKSSTQNKTPAEQKSPAHTEIPSRTISSTPPTQQSNSSSITKESLPGWEKLKPEERALIVSAKLKPDNSWDITYNTNSKRYKCPNCGTISPEEIMTCPGCGLQF